MGTIVAPIITSNRLARHTPGPAPAIDERYRNCYCRYRCYY